MCPSPKSSPKRKRSNSPQSQHAPQDTPQQEPSSSTKKMYLWNPYSSVQTFVPDAFRDAVLESLAEIIQQQEDKYKTFDLTIRQPHITIVPHWISYYQFQSVATLLSQRIKSGMKPFRVRIGELKYFEQKRHCTIYAVPEPESIATAAGNSSSSSIEENPFHQLVHHIHDSISLRVNKRKEREYCPHITIARCETAQEAEQIIAAASDLNFTYTIDTIVFCSRLHGQKSQQRLKISLRDGSVETLNPLPPKCQLLINVKLPPPNCALTDGDLWSIFQDFGIRKAHHVLKNGQSSGFATLLMESVEEKLRLIQYSREHGGFPINGGRQRIYCESFY